MSNDSLPSLPRGWAWTRLGEIAQPSDEKADPTKLERMAYVGLEHIEKDCGQLLGRGYSDEVRSTKNRFNAGDLLYGKLRPYLNKVYVAEFDGVCSTDILVFSSKSYVSNKFVLYRLLCADFVAFASRNVSGVQHPRVSFDTLSHFVIPLPPLPEQHRIVAKIEELVTRLDAGVEALKKVRAQLKAYRQAVLKHAFDGKLTAEWREAHGSELELASVLLERIKEERQKNAKGKFKELRALDTSDLPELPEGWVWTRLGEITQTVEKVSPKAVPDEEFTYIDIASIDGQSIVAPKKYLGKEAPSRARQLVKSGDVLFSTVRTYLKHIAMVAERYDGQIASTGFCVIRPWSCIDSKLMFYLVQTDTFLNPLTQTQRGTSYPAVRDSDVFGQPLPLPPVPEQHKIVEEIERRFSLANEVEKTVERGLKQAERLRQSILKRAFEGKLVPQDPTDEAAERLLERIRAEKAIRELQTKPTRKVPRETAATQRRLI